MNKFANACLFAVLVVATGCNGNTASVSGTVSYDGRPVDRGSIAFLPADGAGPTAGGDIVDGRYSVSNVTPGQKIVQVIGVKQVPFARSTEEMARRAAENKAKGDGSGLIDPADTVPAEAEGNNARHEIKAGGQTLHIELKRPAKAKTS
jgi:hypothetical protein